MISAALRFAGPSGPGHTVVTHGGGEDDRELAARVGEGEEVGGLFERIGAVGDDDACTAVQCRPCDGLRKSEQVFVAEADARDLRDVDRFDGHAVDGQPRAQIFAIQSGRGAVRGRVKGDCAAHRDEAYDLPSDVPTHSEHMVPS